MNKNLIKELFNALDNIESSLKGAKNCDEMVDIQDYLKDLSLGLYAARGYADAIDTSTARFIGEM